MDDQNTKPQSDSQTTTSGSSDDRYASDCIQNFYDNRED
jgi:hypothetical protein